MAYSFAYDHYNIISEEMENKFNDFILEHIEFPEHHEKHEDDEDTARDLLIQALYTMATKYSKDILLISPTSVVIRAFGLFDFPVDESESNGVEMPLLLNKDTVKEFVKSLVYQALMNIVASDSELQRGITEIYDDTAICKKYNVKIDFHGSLWIEDIEAANEDEACDIAIDRFNDCPDDFRYEMADGIDTYSTEADYAEEQ